MLATRAIVRVQTGFDARALLSGQRLAVLLGSETATLPDDPCGHDPSEHRVKTGAERSVVSLTGRRNEGRSLGLRIVLDY